MLCEESLRSLDLAIGGRKTWRTTSERSLGGSRSSCATVTEAMVAVDDLGWWTGWKRQRQPRIQNPRSLGEFVATGQVIRESGLLLSRTPTSEPLRSISPERQL